jgi:hypothetical protein
MILILIDTDHTASLVRNGSDRWNNSIVDK